MVIVVDVLDVDVVEVEVEDVEDVLDVDVVLDEVVVSEVDVELDVEDVLDVEVVDEVEVVEEVELVEEVEEVEEVEVDVLLEDVDVRNVLDVVVHVVDVVVDVGPASALDAASSRNANPIAETNRRSIGAGYPLSPCEASTRKCSTAQPLAHLPTRVDGCRIAERMRCAASERCRGSRCRRRSRRGRRSTRRFRRRSGGSGPRRLPKRAGRCRGSACRCSPDACLEHGFPGRVRLGGDQSEG